MIVDDDGSYRTPRQRKNNKKPWDIEDKKLCIECSWYPRSLWRRVLRLKPVKKKYAQCKHPLGEEGFCNITKEYNHTPCGIKGKLYHKWYKSNPISYNELYKIQEEEIDSDIYLNRIGV